MAGYDTSDQLQCPGKSGVSILSGPNSMAIPVMYDEVEGTQFMHERSHVAGRPILRQRLPSVYCTSRTSSSTLVLPLKLFSVGSTARSTTTPGLSRSKWLAK